MNKNDVTIILATSVLPSHPDTHIIDETINSLRVHFPKNEIIMQIDGLRQEQMDRETDYNEYKNRILWKCLHEYNNVLPIMFDKHSHQSTMMRKTIDDIQTSALLYVEGDAPLTPDVDIDWQKCFDLIAHDKANTIRFHHESVIPEAHNHLMFGMDDIFMRTSQWSQRPHLSKVSYYREVILPPLEDKVFIEDTTHGRIQDDISPYNNFSKEGWNKHKLWIYHPEGNIKRSYHLDGREGGRKFTSDDDVWFKKQ
jgi:hypothetical protein